MNVLREEIVFLQSIKRKWINWR